jgi:hypothetical protein
MSNRLAIPVLACAVVGVFVMAAPQPVSKGCSACSVAQQALDDLQHVKVGMPRSELEKYFVVAGGMTLRSTTRYEYRRCDYLEIEVDFSLDPAIGSNYSPNDTITSISRLFVTYPAKD